VTVEEEEDVVATVVDAGSICSLRTKRTTRRSSRMRRLGGWQTRTVGRGRPRHGGVRLSFLAHKLAEKNEKKGGGVVAAQREDG
jgi:hypothetical protein